MSEANDQIECSVVVSEGDRAKRAIRVEDLVNCLTL